MALVSALGVLGEKRGDLVSPRQAQRSGLHQSFMASAGQGDQSPLRPTRHAAHDCSGVNDLLVGAPVSYTHLTLPTIYSV